MKQITHKNILRKQKIYGLIKLILFLLILFICFEVVYNVTKRKNSYQKTEDFFKQEEDFDVLFLGSSHSVNAIFPMDLWEDYGIVSYNLGNHGERICLTYYNMLLALKETNPKLVVLDVYTVSNTDKMDEKTSYTHDSLDAYPISYTKYQAIKELFDEKNLLEYEMEYLFNFSMYHSRWDEIQKKDFVPVHKYEKGAESRISVVTPNNTSSFESIEEYSGEETINMQYLRKFIEYCKDNNIEILIINLPYPASDKNIAMSKYVQTICDEYGKNYINFLSMDLINYNTDCYDIDSHLNPSGARKVTKYLGEYIAKYYDIPNQSKNEKYNFWNEDYNEYIDYKISNLVNNKNNLNNYLMLLYGEKDIGYEITISSKKEIKQGTALYNLLANLNNNYKIDDSEFEGKEEKNIKIIIWDNRDGKEISTLWF